MEITSSKDVPNGTYFRTEDAEPGIMEDDSICIYNGSGKHRSWGTPGVTSTVIVNEDNFCAIHVGFHHKHGGGQFWRYYTVGPDGAYPVQWRQLTDALRQNILDAASEKAPSWAKSPGSLRSDYKKPQSTSRKGYKLLEVRNGRLYSLYDGGMEYEIGVRVADQARPDHHGGIYAYNTAERVMRLWESGRLVPERCYDDPKRLALVSVTLAGTFIEYSNGKIAATYCTVTGVLEQFDYTPQTKTQAVA